MKTAKWICSNRQACGKTANQLRRLIADMGGEGVINVTCPATDDLLAAAKRCLERIDANGGIGEYFGGPGFVVEPLRKAIEIFEKEIALNEGVDKNGKD